MIGGRAEPGFACFRAKQYVPPGQRQCCTLLLPRNTNTAHPTSGSAAPSCFRAKQYVPPDHKSESGGTSFA